MEKYINNIIKNILIGSKISNTTNIDIDKSLLFVIEYKFYNIYLEYYYDDNDYISIIYNQKTREDVKGFQYSDLVTILNEINKYIKK